MEMFYRTSASVIGGLGILDQFVVLSSDAFLSSLFRAVYFIV